jgi:Tfp pilus assembly ATPase PilU
MRNADSKNELRLRIKLESKRDKEAPDKEGGLSLMDDEDAAMEL